MQLVAYVVPAAVEAVTVEKRCKEALPAYMVPSVVAVLEAWPLNPYGKVDRKSLPSGTAHQQGGTATVWADENESKIAQACSSVLKLTPAQLTRDTNLLELGLTSLLAAACAAKLQKVGLVGLKASSILKSLSVATLSAKLATQDNGNEKRIQFTHSTQAESEAGVGLSAQQHQMWVLYEMDRQSTSYTSPGSQPACDCNA